MFAFLIILLFIFNIFFFFFKSQQCKSGRKLFSSDSLIHCNSQYSAAFTKRKPYLFRMSLSYPTYLPFPPVLNPAWKEKHEKILKGNTGDKLHYISYQLFYDLQTLVPHSEVYLAALMLTMSKEMLLLVFWILICHQNFLYHALSIWFSSLIHITFSVNERASQIYPKFCLLYIRILLFFRAFHFGLST